MACAGVVAMRLDMVDFYASVLEKLKLGAAGELQHYKALKVAGAVPAKLRLPLIRNVAWADVRYHLCAHQLREESGGGINIRHIHAHVIDG